ncbi:MAG: hypothetical protein ACREMO_07380 [Gemmatimonadales bacterium]
MPIRATMMVAGLLLISAPAAAQEPLTQSDSTEARLRTQLRSFYFSLAHQDWEAMSAGIMPAKVVAHHPAPEALLAVRSDDRPGCPPDAPALVDRARITLDGDWAEVSVPHCADPAAGADEFRFIRFEKRWWIVYIDLFREPGAVQLAR